MFLKSAVFILCNISLLYATSEEAKNCIFAQSGTPYHDTRLCTMDDLSERMFQEYTYTNLTKTLAEILDRRNGTSIVRYHDIKSSDKEMPPSSEPEFDHKYFVKNVASFLGEEWVYGQNPRWKDRMGTIHELKVDGGTIEQSVWFLKPFLSSPNFYGLELNTLLDESNLGTVQYLLQKLEEIVMFEHIIISSKEVRAKADIMAKADILANYFAGLLEPLREWLIPVYFSSAFGGHVVLMSFVKTDQAHVDLVVYNTGDGVQFHDTLQGNRHLRHNYALKFSGLHIDHDLMNTTFFDMIAEFTTGGRKGEKYDAELFYNNVLGRFSKYRGKPSTNHLDYSIPQKAGNCYQKVVLAYMKTKLGYHDFKRLATEMRKKLMDKLYGAEFYKKNWFQQEVILRGLKSEARALTRMYKAGKLEKERLGKSVEIIKQRLKLVSSLEIDRYIGARIVTRDQFSRFLHPSGFDDSPSGTRRSETGLEGDILYKKAYSLESPESIIERTQDTFTYVNSRTRNSSAYHGFAWMLQLPLPAVDGEDVYKQFTPQQFSRLLNEMKLLLKSVASRSSRVISLISAGKFLALTWRSLRSRGSPLANAKLDLRALKQSFYSDKIVFYTPEILQEYTNILEYLGSATNQQESDRPLLFEGVTEKQSGKFDFMSETSAEYQFLQSITLTSQEETELSGLERNPPQAEYEIQRALKQDKLRMAYLYIIKNEHVPEEFHLIRDLLFYASELANARPDYRTGKCELNFYMGNRADEVYRIFNTSRYDSDPIIRHLTRHSNSGKKEAFSSYAENELLIKEKPFANPLKTDLALLGIEPYKTKIFFAINCISQYFTSIFADESQLELMRNSFFQGRCFRDFVKSNPLDGTLALKQTLTGVSQKLHLKALLTGDWSAYNNCKDFEALIYHWLGETMVSSVEPKDCPAAYLNNPEALFFVGKKPVYLQEYLAIRLKESYPQSFLKDLMKFEQVIELFAKVGADVDQWIESFNHEYPYISTKIGQISYIYDFWENEFFSGKMKKDDINDNGVLEDCDSKSEYLDLLSETGEFTFGHNRYGIIGQKICKIDNGIEYEAVSKSKDNMLFSSFHPFEHRTSSNSKYIIDFKLSLEPEIAGNTFLVVQETKMRYKKQFTTVFEGQTWKFGTKNLELPKLIDSFGEDRSVLVWTNVLSDEKLFIFTDMFTDDLRTIIFKCGRSGCSYHGKQIIQDAEFCKRHPQSILFEDSDKLFALLPMESLVNHTNRTSCIKFQVENGAIFPIKREKKVQLALYYQSHGLYRKALRTLQSVVLISKFTATELIYLNNIIYFNKRKLDTRPEQAAVSFYALFMKFKLGNQKLELPSTVRLFKEFSELTGDDSEVMSRHYALIGRIPSVLLVTSPIFCATNMKNHKWISCQDERHFIEAILQNHPRLSQINNKIGQISVPCLKNKSLAKPSYYSYDRYDSWDFREWKDNEGVNSIRQLDSKLRIKYEKIGSLVGNVVASMNGQLNGTVKVYIESLLFTAEINSSDLHRYMIILAVLKNPKIAKEVQKRLLSVMEYGSIIEPEVEPILQSLDLSNAPLSPENLVLPPQMIFFNEHSCPEINLKEARMKHNELIKAKTEGAFDTISELLVTCSTLTAMSKATKSFSKLANVLLKNTVISRPMDEQAMSVEYAEMWNKLPDAKIDLASRIDVSDLTRSLFESIVECFRNELTSTKKAVLELANKPSIHYLEEFDGLTTSGLLGHIKIKTLLRPYVTEDLELYFKILKHVDIENIPIIHALMHEYLVFESFHRRSERALKAFEDGEYFKIVEEIQENNTEPDIVPVVLLMEYHLGFRIRPKNISSIQTMAKKYGSSYKNYALQAIMGSGKTEVISPALAFLKADGEHISMFCPPSTHFETNSEKLFSYSENIFGQESYILGFSRDPELTSHDALKRMHESLSDSITSKKNVIVKFESLQSMTNQFISLLNSEIPDITNEKEQTNELTMLAKNLDLIKTKGSIIFDEVDFTFKTNRMFNFPTSISQEMDSDTKEIIKVVLRMTADLRDQLANYGIFPHLGITQNVSKNRWNVVNTIAKGFVDYLFKVSNVPKPLAWTIRTKEEPEICEKLINFLVDEPLGLKNTLSLLKLDEQEIKFMVLVQNLIQSLIPDNWATVCNLHYGLSRFADLKPGDPMYCGVAKPYAFAGEPKETSSWANKYETAVKTFQMYLENGISEAQYVNFIMHLQKNALDEVMYYGKDLEDTDVVCRFNSFNIVNGGEKVKLFHATSELSNCLSSITKAMMVKNLKGTTDPGLVEFILDFVFEIAMKKEVFYGSQIMNNAQFMGTRFKVCQGFSGTAQRDYQFWENVEFIPDLGSSVAVQSTILGQPGLVYQINDEYDALYLATSDRSGDFNSSELSEHSRTVKWTSPNRSYNKKFMTTFQIYKTQENSVFEEVSKPEKVRAMIDLGAFFRTMKNDEVAKKLLEYSGNDIRSIVYYNQANKLSFFRKEKLGDGESVRFYIDGPHELHSEHHKDIERETGSSLDQIFVYYDQKHIIGSDFKMVDDSVAYVTIGPTTTRTDLEQAVMRMRGLLAKLQTIRFIITKDVASNIRTKKKESENECEEVSLFGIIRHCIDNESDMFKSPDTSGRINMQNMQLLYQKVKAQYMDVAFTHLARLAAIGQVDKAKTLFKDVHDWFIDSTDDFSVIEESHYYQTAQVLKGFSDRMFQHLSELSEWKPVREELHSAKITAEKAINYFMKRDIVEPYTPSPVSRKNQNSTEVQNQSQSRNQNQTQHRLEITLSDRPSVDFESMLSELSCSMAASAAMQMQNLWEGKNISFFDDNLKLSPNFIKTEKNQAPFVKTPAYFVRLDECIMAITHKDLELFNGITGGNYKFFILVEDKAISLNGASAKIQLTMNDLVNLLIFKGDFETLNKHPFESKLDEWIEKRRYFGPELVSIIASYDIKETGLFDTSIFKIKLEKTLISRDHIPMSEYSQRELEFFEENPRLGMELVFRKSHPTIEEFQRYFPNQILTKLFANYSKSCITSLFELNPNFVLSLEHLWELSKGQDCLKFEAVFDKPEYEGKTLDISVYDVLGLMYAAKQFQKPREATLKFMRFARDKRLVTFTEMFYNVSPELEDGYYSVLKELFNYYPKDFKAYPNTRELMKIFVKFPRQSVMALHVLDFIGSNHDQWFEIYNIYFECLADFMHIPIGKLLQISNAQDIFETNPSLLDEFVRIAKKREYYEDDIQATSHYLLEKESSCFEEFTKKNKCSMSALIHAITIGHVDEPRLLKVIREMQNTEELEAIAFDLIKNPSEDPNLDLLSLIPYHAKFQFIVNAVFLRYKFDLGRYICGNTSVFLNSDMSAAFKPYAEQLRNHPEYFDKVMGIIKSPYYKESYNALTLVLEEYEIPYIKL